MTVTNLSHELEVSSPKLPLPASNSLLRQNAEEMDFNPNQLQPAGSNEVRDEVLSFVGSQNEKTSGYEPSQLDDNALSWETHQLEANAGVRTRIDTFVSRTAFEELGIGG